MWRLHVVLSSHEFCGAKDPVCLPPETREQLHLFSRQVSKCLHMPVSTHQPIHRAIGDNKPILHRNEPLPRGFPYACGSRVQTGDRRTASCQAGAVLWERDFPLFSLRTARGCWWLDSFNRQQLTLNRRRLALDRRLTNRRYSSAGALRRFECTGGRLLTTSPNEETQQHSLGQKPEEQCKLPFSSPARLARPSTLPSLLARQKQVPPAPARAQPCP